MNPALLSSKRMAWCTPDNVLELVRQVGPIALDPCTVSSNPTKAEGICAHDYGSDGLANNWSMASLALGGLVYVNPPYGRELPQWVDKCIQEANEGAEIILLAPARTDTKWMTKVFDSAWCVAFWHGRMRFKGAPASAPFPTILAYWGPNIVKFSHVMHSHAHIVPANWLREDLREDCTAY